MTNSEDLDAMVARLKAARGTPDEWLEKETRLTNFIAGLGDQTRVFCRGEVRMDKGYFPAVLTYNAIYRQTLAWAPSGKKGVMEAHHEGVFWSNIPHVGIAREVLDGAETRVVTALATPTHRRSNDHPNR